MTVIPNIWVRVLIDIVYYSDLLVDAGVTSHIINDKSKFIAFDGNFDLSSHVIELADGSKANVVTGIRA